MWYEKLRENANKDIVTILIGNKSDLEEDRIITF